MVHVKKCPLGKRGNPSREFIKDGRWQVYCYGWIDRKTDEPLPECQKCLDFVGGDKFLDDYEEAAGEGKPWIN